MTFSVSTLKRVTAVLEHTRTIQGKKDPVSGHAILEHVNLGWFIHLGETSYGVGQDRPEVEAGDTIELILRKVPAP